MRVASGPIPSACFVWRRSGGRYAIAHSISDFVGRGGGVAGGRGECVCARAGAGVAAAGTFASAGAPGGTVCPERRHAAGAERRGSDGAEWRAQAGAGTVDGEPQEPFAGGTAAGIAGGSELPGAASATTAGRAERAEPAAEHESGTAQPAAGPVADDAAAVAAVQFFGAAVCGTRSEERRVGKECRSR